MKAEEQVDSVHAQPRVAVSGGRVPGYVAIGVLGGLAWWAIYRNLALFSVWLTYRVLGLRPDTSSRHFWTRAPRWARSWRS